MQNKPDELIKIYFDGGSIGNGTLNKGYGSFEIDGGEYLKYQSLKQEFKDPATCNVAEYQALIAALRWLSHHVNPSEHRLSIYTDSRLVVNQVRRKWRCKVNHLKELRDEVREWLAPYRRWEINWHGRINNVNRFGH